MNSVNELFSKRKQPVYVKAGFVWSICDRSGFMQFKLLRIKLYGYYGVMGQNRVLGPREGPEPAVVHASRSSYEEPFSIWNTGFQKQNS
jgi:hypothetical protein